MRLNRTAQRAARAVYGSIIALALILLYDKKGGEADEVLPGVIGAVIAATLAELYAEYVKTTIQARHHPSGEEMRESVTDAAFGTVAALVPLTPFVLVALGVLELDTAYPIAIWAGIGVIGGYAMLANRLAGLSVLRSLLFTLGAIGIGLGLVGLKALTH